MTKKFLLALTICLSLSGCALPDAEMENSTKLETDVETSESEVNEQDPASGSGDASISSQIKKMPDAFTDNILTQTLPVDGEDFSLIVKYDTGNYPTDSWEITSAKSISMEVKTSELPEESEVFIDNVHIDSSILSLEPEFNSIPTDTMDDNIHTSMYPGFPIGNDMEYHGIFSMDGYSETLISGYTRGYYSRLLGWGSQRGSVEEVRVTEDDLKKSYVYGNKFQIVYDLWIKKTDNEYPYMRSVLSEFIIPTTFYIKLNKGTKSYLGYKISTTETVYTPIKWVGNNKFSVYVPELGETRDAYYEDGTLTIE